MILTEGTCICLLLGIGSLVLVFKHVVTDLFLSFLQTTPPEAPRPAPAPAPPSPPPPPVQQLSPEEERERLEAQMESLYREEWLKKFEEEEVIRRFNEKFLEQEFNRQCEEFEEAKEKLEILMEKRQTLERYLMTTGEIPGPPQPPPYY
jgi:hypothetical protein